jgi:hypothetical protein
MALSIPQWVAVAFIGIASGCWPLSLAAAPVTTNEQQNRSPVDGIGASNQLASVIGLRPTTEVGESRPTEKKRGATRRDGELFVLILHILRGAK